MSAVFAETGRLLLRSLEKSDLPRLVKLLDVWEVVRWLPVVPYPYTLRDAEDFFEEIADSYAQKKPQFFTMAFKHDKALIGGVGLHAPRNPDHAEGDVEIGYWLGRPFWGQGLMTEAVRSVAAIGFSWPSTDALVSTTIPGNGASNRVLSKLGLRNMGLARRNYATLRGEDELLKWRLTRNEWAEEQLRQPSSR